MILQDDQLLMQATRWLDRILNYGLAGCGSRAYAETYVGGAGDSSAWLF